jgi:hypothetical protein
MNPIEVLWFIFLGLLGGITYAIINSKKWADLITFSSCKRYIIGVIIGFLYNILYSEYSFPNTIMCWVSGYMGVTFIEGLLNRFLKKNGT